MNLIDLALAALRVLWHAVGALFGLLDALNVFSGFDCARCGRTHAELPGECENCGHTRFD